MQQKQVNYKVWLFGILLVSTGFLAGERAYSAGIAQRQAGDPILDGGPPGPCNPQTDSADYVGGTDVNGHPVASADLDAPPVPVPGNVLIPLKAGKGRAPAYVQADGKKLDSLLHPQPACPVAKGGRNP